MLAIAMRLGNDSGLAAVIDCDFSRRLLLYNDSFGGGNPGPQCGLRSGETE